MYKPAFEHSVARSIILKESGSHFDPDIVDAYLAAHRIKADALEVLSVENSVKSRTSHGGTAPQNVRKMAKAWIKRLEKAAGKV